MASVKSVSISLFLIIVFSPLVLSAQQKTGSPITVDGQIAASTNGEAVFVNLGGPSIKFYFNTFTFAINMMPSLRFQKEEPKAFVTPTLGAGLQFYLLRNRKFIITVPCYYSTTTNKWTVTGGLGYVLTTTKK